MLEKVKAKENLIWIYFEWKHFACWCDPSEAFSSPQTEYERKRSSVWRSRKSFMN